MAKHNSSNTRIKRDYFQYLKEAMRRDEASIDAVAKALSRFEESNGYKDFGRFEPSRDYRRLFGFSYAAMGVVSSMA
jgi:hypothetical protein